MSWITVRNISGTIFIAVYLNPYFYIIMLPLTRHLHVFLFCGSILVFVFWLSSISFNVYSVTLAGVIFELLWLPMVLLIGVLPIWAFIKWRKEHFILRSFNAGTLLVALLTIILISVA